MKIRSLHLSDHPDVEIYLFKTLNRMNDLVPNVKIEGTVLLDGEDIYDPQVDTTLLRKSGNGVPAAKSISDEYL